MSTSDLLGKKMLLATDGSEDAELATRAAVELAEGTGSNLHVVYVEPLPDFMKPRLLRPPGALSCPQDAPVGSPTAALFALHQSGVGEPGQDAGQ